MNVSKINTKGYDSEELIKNVINEPMLYGLTLLEDKTRLYDAIDEKYEYNSVQMEMLKEHFED